MRLIHIIGMIYTLFFAISVHAQEFMELQSRSSLLKEYTSVDDNYAATTVREQKIIVLAENKIKKFKKRTFSFSTSIEQFEVLEAFTIKATGKKIIVPEGNYQKVTNAGVKEGGPVFSDRSSITVVFPDLEVGDSIYYKTKRKELEPMFPKHFSDSHYFWQETAFDNVEIVFDLPQKMKYDLDVRKMDKVIRKKNGRQLITLNYSNVKPLRSSRTDYSVWDDSDEAGFAISTYKSYESIAKAYGARALEKSIATKRVRALAKEIVGGELDDYQKARKLYEWVAKNISYAGNCIGVGAVVPHDTDFILDNRMGDCKDHATLLEALLTAEDIDSTQALINSGSRYKLPKVALVSSVNHVINYLPEWDKFVDSTYSSMPFESLAFSIQGKPVILVSGFKKGMKTPASSDFKQSQKLKSTMKLSTEGVLTGDVDISLLGQPAISSRRAWRNITEQQETRWLEGLFSSKNTKGEASIEKDDATALLTTFSYSMVFTRPDYLNKGATGAFTPLFPARTPYAIYMLLGYPKEDIEGYDVVCGMGESTEEISIVLPKNMKILAMPEDFKLDANYISYQAEFSIDDQVLSVKRKLSDTSPGNVCSASLINAQRKTAKKIADSLQTQVVYQFK